jgi:hypothetical protein
MTSPMPLVATVGGRAGNPVKRNWTRPPVVKVEKRCSQRDPQTLSVPSRHKGESGMVIPHHMSLGIGNSAGHVI